MKNTTINSVSGYGKNRRQWRVCFWLLTALLSVTTGFSQTGTIGIGSGTSTNGLIPINSCYNYNYTQQIVKASEYATGGGISGEITKIRYYYSSGGTTFGNWNEWTVYLGHTTKTEFSANDDWEPVANLTQVYSGAITPVGGNWFEITLSTPFNYDGTSNLIVAVDENLSGFSCTANFGSYSSTSNTGLYYYSDGTNPDPASPPNGTRTSTLARLQFEGSVASCLPPTALSLAGLGTDSADVSWTAETNASGGYEYYYNTSGDTPDASQTASGSVAAGETTANVTGLTPNTMYYVWVRSLCDGSDVSAWSSSISFTTLCTATDLPYYQDAETASTPGVPECITLENVGLGNNWSTTNNPGYGFDGIVFRYQYNSSNPADAWFFTQGLNLTGGVSYRLAYRYGNDSTFYTESLQVAYGTSGTAAAMTNSLADYPEISMSGSEEVFVDFTPATSGVYYIGFNAYSIANQNRLFVDDISVMETPSCEPVVSVSAEAASFESGLITWPASASDPADGYNYYVSTSDEIPTETTVATGSVAAGVTEATVSGLTPNTTYYAWVQAVCSDSDSSPWEGPASFFTGYCTPAPSTMDGDGIVGFLMGTINNETGAEPSYYGDYSAMSTDFPLAATVDFAITYNTGYTYGTKIWVDWNNDTDFDDEGELVYEGLSENDEPTTLEGSFSIPADAAIGAHRVRIGGTDNNSGPSGPCYTGFWGSFEDYTLNVFMPDPPVITEFTPDAYCAVSGDITITGTSLGFASSLEIGGTAIDITSNTDTEIVATVPAGVSGTVSVTTVAGTATTTDEFSVTEPANLTLSGTETTICAGDDSELVTITEGLADFDTFIWSPADGVSGDATNGYVFTATETTTFTLTASQSAGNCEIATDYVVNVNPVPNPVTVVPSSVVACQGSPIMLTAEGGETISAAEYCLPTVGSTGSSGDFIGSFSFADLANNGSDDAASDYTYYSDMTANVVAGQTYDISVDAGGTWGQRFRVWVDFNMDGEFTEDESIFDTTTATTEEVTGTATIPTTAFNGYTRMRVGCRYGATGIGADEACGHTGFGEWEDYNVIVTGGASAVEFVWSPMEGLYSDPAATMPYTGEPAQMVYAKPMADATYTATVTTDLGCPASDSVDIEVIITPAPTGQTDYVFTTAATVADLEATGENIQWYNVAEGGTALAESAELTSGMYYATQTVNGCESQERLAVTVSVPEMDWINLQWPPQLTVVQGETGMVYAQGYREGVTSGAGPGIGVMAWIGVSEANTDPSTWTTWIPMTFNTQVGNNDEFVAAIGDDLEPGTYYYASRFQYLEGPYRYGGYSAEGGSFWDGDMYVSGVLTVNCGTEAPVADAAQSFCYSAIVADLVAEGDMVMWYATAQGGSPLLENVALANGGTYYASQTIGCESEMRTAVTVTINSTAAPTGDAAQVFEAGATVADLMANGEMIMWYDAEVDGNMLSADDALVDGMTYYASQTMNGCESQDMLEVTVTVNEPTMDYVSLQYPGTISILQGQSGMVYVQGYEAGVTPGTGPGVGVSAWVGISSEDTDPSTWTEWVPATFNIQSGNNDEFVASIGSDLEIGTYYYAARFQLEDGPYTYGGYNANGGNTWDGVMYMSGVLEVLCPASTPSASADQIFCQSATVADLSANGEMIQWYMAAEGGEPLAMDATVMDGMTYYASQTMGGCESVTRAAVTAQVVVVEDATGASEQQIEVVDADFATVADIDITGTNVVWYASMEDAMAGDNPLAADAMIEEGATYYAVSTMSGCSSMSPLAVTITSILAGERFDITSFNYYPNPVKDVLVMNYSSEITSVAVFNMLGQEVMNVEPNTTEAKIDMSILADGTYVVQVTAGTVNKTIKVVKKQ